MHVLARSTAAAHGRQPCPSYAARSGGSCARMHPPVAIAAPLLRAPQGAPGRGTWGSAAHRLRDARARRPVLGRCWLRAHVSPAASCTSAPSHLPDATSDATPAAVTPSHLRMLRSASEGKGLLAPPPAARAAGKAAGWHPQVLALPAHNALHHLLTGRQRSPCALRNLQWLPGTHQSRCGSA